MMRLFFGFVSIAVAFKLGQRAGARARCNTASTTQSVAVSLLQAHRALDRIAVPVLQPLAAGRSITPTSAIVMLREMQR